jgi:predicted acetyltransferase
MTLRLRPYQPNDEAAALAAHDALLTEDFHFLLSWHPTMTWTEFLLALENQRWGLDLAEDQVPAVQLAAVVNGELVGRVSIRFVLKGYPSDYQRESRLKELANRKLGKWH